METVGDGIRLGGMIEWEAFMVSSLAAGHAAVDFVMKGVWVRWQGV